MKNPIGIYEKALPKDLSWAERFAAARAAGYDFLEISVDETPERMARLEWSMKERLEFFRASRESGIPVPTMCLSGHRKIPFGSADPAIRAQADDFMAKAIRFAAIPGYGSSSWPGTTCTTSRRRANHVSGITKEWRAHWRKRHGIR